MKNISFKLRSNVTKKQGMPFKNKLSVFIKIIISTISLIRV
jgi:hypothetical protein